MKIGYYPLLFITVLCFACNSGKKKQESKSIEIKESFISPDRLYGDLFKEVQMQKVFPDGKTFVDCIPKFSSEEILKKYEEQKKSKGFDLKDFVLQNFELPENPQNTFKSDTSRSVEQHIQSLWSVLSRQPDAIQLGTKIPLPFPYIVPGGRFREIYYWDSYFTMLGLKADGKTEIVENMVKNFAYMMDTIGYIPNGNRTYYLGRSQPPFFALMVGVLAEIKGEKIYADYLKQLEKEYDFWMDGKEKLTADKPAYRRVVLLSEKEILNRYWDDNDTPRPESYKEDVETAKKSSSKQEITYRHLRAAAESGWDFCSRWLKDGKNLHTIHTTDFIPVDLNALLYNLEMSISKAYTLQKNEIKAKEYRGKADKRVKTLLKYCWNEKEGFLMDYDFVSKVQKNVPSLAGLYPLCFKMLTQSQAEKIARYIEKNFLKTGGLPSTLNDTGQQWDAPNGWAPLQWMSIWGLRNYNQNDLAEKITKNWIKLNVDYYKKNGKMIEKYNVVNPSLVSGGGEYPTQDGFGWTNGVLLQLMKDK